MIQIRNISWNVFVVLLVFSLANRACAQRIQKVDLNPQQVLKSISEGVTYLKRQQHKSGGWGAERAYVGGPTALCTLALLHSGVKVEDPVIQNGLAYLRKLTPQKTYTRSLLLSVFCLAEPKLDMIRIQKLVNQLEATQIKAGQFRGAWSYPLGGGDNSNAQYAVLGLYEALRVGAKVRRKTWIEADAYWRRAQNRDGSWGYGAGRPGTGSMTCAGIGALAICEKALNKGDARVTGDKIRCCLAHQDDKKIEGGLKWLASHFSVRQNPIAREWHFYYLYGLERAGRLTARRFIGRHDWYREGTELLLGRQDRLSHYWKGSSSYERQPIISTSFALLFLSKGRRPVLIGKAKYGQKQEWNHHRHDAMHLTSFAEKHWQIDMTWQVIDPRTATVEDLTQVPVLYLSGDQATDLLPHAKKLRDYIDRGGFIFAESSCKESLKFQKSFRQLMEAVFPESEYFLRQLRPAHPIWRMDLKVSPESEYIGRLWGIEYGCRTCVVFSEKDLSCFWELRSQEQLPVTFADGIEAQIDDAFAVGLNVLAYATNRKPRGKEAAFVEPIEDVSKTAIGSRGTIEIVKLRHGGGCNAAPMALANLLRAASQGDLKLRVKIEPELIGIGEKSLFNYHMAFMHGRHAFRLTPDERKQLRLFLQRGGTLLVDAICANKEFAKSFQREINASFPDQNLQRIPAEDPIFSKQFGGYDLRKVAFRDPEQAGAGSRVESRVSKIEPRMEGIKIEGRWAVIFSPFDLSCALERDSVIECRGYTQQDAARLGLNVILYSINR